MLNSIAICIGLFGIDTKRHIAMEFNSVQNPPTGLKKHVGETRKPVEETAIILHNFAIFCRTYNLESWTRFLLLLKLKSVYWQGHFPSYRNISIAILMTFILFCDFSYHVLCFACK